MHLKTHRSTWELMAFVMALSFGTGPAFANYEACMRFCVAEHSFSHCNLQCGLASGGKKDSGGKKAEKAESRNNEISVSLELKYCDGTEDQAEAIHYLIQEHFDPSVIFYTRVDETRIDVEFFPFPDGRVCNAIATFSHDCDLSFVYECEAE